MRVTFYFPHHRESDPRQRDIQNILRNMLLPMAHLGRGEVTWFSLRPTKECESCPARFRYCVAALYVCGAGGRGFGPRGRHLSTARTKSCFVPNRGSKWYDGEFYVKSFCPSPNIASSIKPKKTTCAGHVARIGETRNAQHKNVLGGIFKGNILLQRQRIGFRWLKKIQWWLLWTGYGNFGLLIYLLHGAESFFRS